MRILFTSCGRAGSKGLKNKNLKVFCGAPLAYYSLGAIRLYMEQYGQEHEIDVVLNTDSEDLIALVQRQTVLTVHIIRRQESLGGDTVPKVAVIKDCLIRMEERQGYAYDVVVDLDLTSPLRTVEDVRNAIEKKVGRADTDVVYSVTGSRRNPCFNMVKEEAGYFVKAMQASFTTRQQAPAFYDMNASIYAYSPVALKEKDATIFFNDKADAIMMKDTAVLDIDSEEDFELMEVVAQYLLKTDAGLKRVQDMAVFMAKP